LHRVLSFCHLLLAIEAADQMREMMAARVLETLCGDEDGMTGRIRFGSSLRASPRSVLFAVDLFDDIDRVSGRFPAQMLAQI
jgi:hypothetical protein